MSGQFRASCNRIVYDCGCVSWLELKEGEWRHMFSRSYFCRKHGQQADG